ncbi:MAG: hypothetical protein JXQ72_04550 [Anaerolineae bacterium]|nr:hypothetical protein [Anaerolineae bacterium]
MSITRTRLFGLLIVLILVLPTAVPALAQGPGDPGFQSARLSVTHWDGELPILIIEDEDRIVFYPTGQENGLTLYGETDTGKPLIIFFPNPMVQGTPRGENQFSFGVEREISLTAQIDGFAAPIPLSAYGTLACNGAGCETLSVQMAACSTGSDYQLGFALYGSLLPGTSGREMFQKPGTYPLSYANVSVTGYLTAPGVSNPLCGGRDLGAVFAEEYTPVASITLPDRSADSPVIELPEGEDWRIDSNVLIDIVSVGLRDMEIILHVRGAFFGQCGSAAQVRVWENSDPARLTIYRFVREGAVCDGGLEPFEVTATLEGDPDNPLVVGSRFRVNVNGQIIAILIG